MAADSLTPETDVRTRPNPEDESSPSTAPVAPAIATSVIMIEPPAPEALPPPPPVVEPGVPEPRPDEATRVEIVTAPKTSEERAWGLGFFALVTLVFTLATLAALAWNWSYVVRLSGLPAALQSWAWPPFPFPALPSAILATIQMVALGAVAYRFLFPRHTEPWEAIAFVLGLGEGLTGLTGTILALTGHFTFGWIEVVLLGEISAFVLFSLPFRTPIRPSLSRWVAVVRSLRPHPSPFEWLALAGVVSIAVLVFYQATVERIIETDSLIYHAPLAALVYYHGGLPWIVGGGVGLSSSANYPQAFSLLGAYYYAWTGSVNDVYLRLLGAANWCLVIYATFLIGRRLAGRPHGVLAAGLAALVPSFVSYAFLATQETTLVMFGALGFLALLKATHAKQPGYAIVGGLLLGGAALTSYQGLYFVLPVVALYGIALLRRLNVRLQAFLQAEPLRLLLILLVATLVGSAPYVRNWILLGDPLYPFYRGLFSSPYLSPTTMGFAEMEWRSVALDLASSGPLATSYWDFLFQFGTNPSFAPLSLAFAVPAFLILPAAKIRRKLELACFYFVVLAAILAGPVPFIRYVWLLIPFSAIVVAGAAFAALRALRTWAAVDTRARPARIATEAVGRIPVVVLASLFILPLVAGFGGNAYFFGANTSQGDYFRYFGRPGTNLWSDLQQTYGSDPSAWRWFNDHLQPGQRIASLEYRVYYIEAALRVSDTMLYLDSQEAEPLYVMTDPGAMSAYLQAHRVSYVFVRSMDWNGFTSAALPLFQWLGSPDFPWVAIFGKSMIFAVGIQPYPDVPAGNPVGLYGIAGLTSPEIFLGKRVLRIQQDNNTPRVSVFTPVNPEVLVVRYWDSGDGLLVLNVRRAADKTWYTVDRSQKGNTSTWRTAVFPLPQIAGQSVLELGLHATGSDFIVDDIEVKPIVEPWFALYGSQGNRTFPNETRPSAVFIYLPFLMLGQRLTVTATAGGLNLSIEVFRNLIRPELRTGWWLQYSARARIPALPTQGTASPRLDYTVAASGTYTLVIVLWSPWKAGITPDVQITIR